MKLTRRRLLETAALSPAAAGASLTASSPSSLYARLGVKPVINGVGVVTVLGGSIMPPEVVRAIEEASRYFIPLPELEKKVGERIAEKPELQHGVHSYNISDYGMSEDEAREPFRDYIERYDLVETRK